MRNFLAILFVVFTSGLSSAQDWYSFDSINNTSVYSLESIEIDQESNTALINQVSRIGIIKDDGVKTTIGSGGTVDFQYGFGSEYTVKAHYHDGKVYNVSGTYGLHRMSFNPVFKDTILHNFDVENVFVDNDTLWVSGDNPGDPTKIVNESIHQPFVMYREFLIKYKGQVYGHSRNTSDGGFVYHNGTEFIKFKEDNSSILSNYVGGFCTNSEDGIMFVGTKEGISQFNGVTFTSITPDNHPDMPYKTVIDIEYDQKNGKLWMILGDTNFNAKTLTSYNGSWETFDHTNTPIDFAEFKDMAVDTLGQIWVGEDREVHVFSTDELQGWLGIKKQEQLELEVNVYPNPSTGIVNIQIAKQGTFTLKVYNSNGQEVYQNSKATGSMELDLPKGIYHYTISDGQTKFKSGKIIRL
jgi:ligand-binding sensor domain-containing protein